MPTHRSSWSVDSRWRSRSAPSSEREIHHQQAGFRTYALVCLGAAVFTGVSGAAFGGTQDPTRIAAQVVSGIGFIAAGTILRGDGGTVRGLSTAAGL